MLAGLGHGAIGGGDDEDSSVHLGGSGDHVFDVIGVTRAGGYYLILISFGSVVIFVENKNQLDNKLEKSNDHNDSETRIS